MADASVAKQREASGTLPVCFCPSYLDIGSETVHFSSYRCKQVIMVTWKPREGVEMAKKRSFMPGTTKNIPDSPTSTLEQCGGEAQGDGVSSKNRLCITMRPTKEEFCRPFAEYVQEVFQNNPDCPCFRVVPPKGWKPRQGDYDFSKVNIGAPIKQHVFGRSGAYMCILEEQKPLSGSSYAALATHPNRSPPTRKKPGDVMMERSFWSSITMNPPIYGADTPLSLFDETVPWGWNLQKLGCLFKEYKVPEIAGVTTPMTYFGMWKAFFAWHKEDLDLYSINFLHGGASKVWYCVPPSESDKFDAMAQQLFPELASDCPDFLRHKNVMISPSLLRTFNINYVQALQEPGDFIVLNASAYHAGFNLGFNCAEAVNFALPDWLEIGKQCSYCECGALSDSVSLDMSIFFPGLYDSTSSDDVSGNDSGDNDEDDNSTSLVDETSSSEQRQSTAEEDSRISEGESCDLIEGNEDQAAVSGNVSLKKRGRPPGSKNKVKRPSISRLTPVSKTSTSNTDHSLRKGVSITNSLPREAFHVTWGSVVDEKPIALVTKGDRGQRVFTLVHRLYRPASRPESAWFGVLEKDQDGLYCPKGETLLVQLTTSSLPKLVNVRTEWACPGTRRRGGWKLLSREERILM